VVETTKFLGLLLDDSLSWKPHITYISQKVAKSIGILSMARKVLDRKTLIQLYYSFIYPYLNYCNLSWGNAADTTLWPIFRLQKISIRIIFNIKNRASTLLACKSYGILRLPDIHLMNIGIFMYKYKRDKLPHIFNDVFIENCSIHSYSTRNANKLRIPRVRTTLADIFIRKTGVKLWNDITENIDTTLSIFSLKKLLKKFLTSKYLQQ
jgi:hypothetical protein